MNAAVRHGTGSTLTVELMDSNRAIFHATLQTRAASLNVWISVHGRLFC